MPARERRGIGVKDWGEIRLKSELGCSQSEPSTAPKNECTLLGPSQDDSAPAASFIHKLGNLLWIPNYLSCLSHQTSSWLGPGVTYSGLGLVFNRRRSLGTVVSRNMFFLHCFHCCSPSKASTASS